MKIRWIILITIFAVSATIPPNIRAQRGSESAHDLVLQDREERQFENGDTNAPLVAMDWFPHPQADVYCRISRSGWLSSGRNDFNFGTLGHQLDQTKLAPIKTTLESLPPPPKILPPQERWLVIRAMRTNSWVKYIYDRADVPREVEELYRITGAYLEWFILKTNGRALYTNSAMGSFLVAKDSPVGVSFDPTNIQIWNLDREKVVDTVLLDIVPVKPGYGHSRALSPDGKILIAAQSGEQDENGVCAVDLKQKKVLWKTASPEHDGDYYIQHVATGGDHGQFVFVAGAHSITRRDLATGKCLAIIATNETPVLFLETSQNGKVLLAGFRDPKSGYTPLPSLFAVWRADEDKPAARDAETIYTVAALSPDGRTVALRNSGRKLILWDWQKGTKQEIPLRLPYGAFGLYEMHWSPDGKIFGGREDSSAKMILLYETTDWKPLVGWPSHRPTVVAGDRDFLFEGKGKIIELSSGEVLDFSARH